MNHTTTKPTAEKPVKDVAQIIRYLTNTFNRVTAKIDRAQRGKTGPNMAYILQFEFAYLLNEVMQGPRCEMQRNIVECNEFLDQVIQELAKDSASA